MIANLATAELDVIEILDRVAIEIAPNVVQDPGYPNSGKKRNPYSASLRYPS